MSKELINGFQKKAGSEEKKDDIKICRYRRVKEKSMGKTTYIVNMLHMACKAGRVKVGMTASCSSCLKNKSELVICATDMSKNSKDKIEKTARLRGVKFLVYGDKGLYSQVFKRQTTGIISIEDKNFASALMKVIG